MVKYVVRVDFKNDQRRTYQIMFMRLFCCFFFVVVVVFFCLFFSNFLYKSICCWYSFELHRQVDAIQMGSHNICLYKEVDKVYLL